jgi:hypothetical protein
VQTFRVCIPLRLPLRFSTRQTPSFFPPLHHQDVDHHKDAAQSAPNWSEGLLRAAFTRRTGLTNAGLQDYGHQMHVRYLSRI